jgi:hypothetical protein
MKPPVARTALLTLAAGILTGGALALGAGQAAADQRSADTTPGLVAVSDDVRFNTVGNSFSNPSGN